MKIYSVTDKKFKRYGRVIELDTKEIVSVGKSLPMQQCGVSYTASEPQFEKLAVAETIKNEYFGGIDTQIGFCCGHNNSLNALEWHTCSEINIGISDLILLLGDVRDVEPDGRYNSSRVEAFRLSEGQAIEVYATTLHYCPIEVSPNGFGSVVALVKGTNTEFEHKSGDKLLFAKNKWLIAHEDNEELIGDGAFGGIYGENYSIKF